MPSDSLDNLFASARGIVSHQDIRTAVAESIRSELHDPVVDAFRNLCRMTADDISRFNPLRLSSSGVVSNPFDYSSGEDSLEDKGLLRSCAAPKFFYTIGEYETSSFYREFLSDEAVRAPSGRMVTVRDMTDEVSRNPKSCFRS
jgi:hypothetical protein